MHASSPTFSGGIVQRKLLLGHDLRRFSSMHVMQNMQLSGQACITPLGLCAAGSQVHSQQPNCQTPARHVAVEAEIVSIVHYLSIPVTRRLALSWLPRR